MERNPSGATSCAQYARRVGDHQVGGYEDNPERIVGVRRVLVVSKTHLDVGFTEMAVAVRRRYLDDFFPRAMTTAAELRSIEGAARFRWTTGSWILTEALESADRASRRALENAIHEGDLCWHALPFTVHSEFADRSLIEHGLSLSVELDRRFDRHTVAAKMTDVPGHTRAMVSLLSDAGVELLHIGVNPVAAVPRVPNLFVWRDEAVSGEAVPGGVAPCGVAPRGGMVLGGAVPELAVMYQPGGYGDVQMIEGTDTAVVLDVTGDNVGPPSADDVIELFSSLSERFPGAALEAATLDDVARVIARVRSTLPVLTAEIGDTWIHGVGTDPNKVAGFRALARQRAGWIRDGLVQVDDPAFRRASTRLLMVAEHTWGLDQKSHWPDTDHWSTRDLSVVRDDPSTRRFEASWTEQRNLLDEYVSTLSESGHRELAWAAQAELDMSSSEPAMLPTAQLEPVQEGQRVEMAGWVMKVDGEGNIIQGESSMLSAVSQQTFDAADYERWYDTYNASVGLDDEWWARWDNTKPGLERSGARSAKWPTTLVGAWIGTDEQGELLVVDTRVVTTDDDPVSAPDLYRTTLRPSRSRAPSSYTRSSPVGLSLELAWWNRAAARWPGAVWWQLSPRVAGPDGWQMVKLGEKVSPFDVVDGGARHLHVADSLVHADGTVVELLDSGLVAPGDPKLLIWDASPVSLASGWHVCVHNNVWGTNFPMWVEGAGRCRVVLWAPWDSNPQPAD